MTFTSVLLFCTGGIAVCAALVFLVETLVAFCLHEEEHTFQATVTLLSFDDGCRDLPSDKAA